MQKAIREAYLKIEPLLFSVTKPILHSRKTRLQRSVAAQRYLRGRGLEIGALAQPTMVPRDASIVYVDRNPFEHWAGVTYLKGEKVVRPDVVDDGLVLSTQADDSYDYLAASHMLEHADDPIRALKNWVRVVKPGGYILVIVPDKRFNADRTRPLTTIEHLIRDHEEGPGWSAEGHYRDIAVNKKGWTDDAQVAGYIAEAPPAVHFHVWTVETFTEFLIAANRYLGDVYELVEARLNVGEALCVLKVK